MNELACTLCPIQKAEKKCEAEINRKAKIYHFNMDGSWSDPVLI